MSNVWPKFGIGLFVNRASGY